MFDVIFDIDGTIADLTHRLHWIKTKPKNYQAFMKACPDDTPILPVIRVLNALQGTGVRIILCSGRSDDYRHLTMAWLDKHEVRYDKLYMRASGDYRQDSIVKSELLQDIKKDGYEPCMVFDDRQQVVDMWRKEGLICCQVDEGNF